MNLQGNARKTVLHSFRVPHLSFPGSVQGRCDRNSGVLGVSHVVSFCPMAGGRMGGNRAPGLSVALAWSSAPATESWGVS